MELIDSKVIYCSLNKHGQVTKKYSILCSWYEKIIRTASEQMSSGTSVFIGKSVIIRIPSENLPEGLSPKSGDMLVKGECTDAENDISLKKAGAVTVMAVTDNTRGLCPHMKLEAV